jgi:hypothetical protein
MQARYLSADEDKRTDRAEPTAEFDSKQRVARPSVGAGCVTDDSD